LDGRETEMNKSDKKLKEQIPAKVINSPKEAAKILPFDDGSKKKIVKK
jgi:hypothetical protein